jgi:AAA family ATP:ADP antiporter
MFKQVWSMIHVHESTFVSRSAYGIIFASGTVGSIVGSLVPTWLAGTIGSRFLLLFTLPIYLIFALLYRHTYASYPFPPISKQNSSDRNHSLIRNNPFLIGILLLVLLMQLSVGITEYRFSHHLEQELLGLDVKTAYCGRLSSIANALSFLFQVIGSKILLHTIGLKGSHLLIPIILGTFSLLGFWAPTFSWISFMYVSIKAIDYSLFGVVREMLYIPLHPDAKFKAKAYIDVFTYRSSKALVSILILGAQVLLHSHLFPFLYGTSLLLFVLWVLVVLFLFRRQEGRSMLLKP